VRMVWRWCDFSRRASADMPTARSILFGLFPAFLFAVIVVLFFFFVLVVVFFVVIVVVFVVFIRELELDGRVVDNTNQRPALGTRQFVVDVDVHLVEIDLRITLWTIHSHSALLMEKNR
jgi:membrane protein implicated in regulation of membrane protease activity